MPQIDLRHYVVSRSGTWTEAARLAETFQPQRLMLAWQRDQITLAGPLRVKVTFYAENVTLDAQGVSHFHPSQIYSYVLEIPPGQTWSYQLHEEAGVIGRLGNNAGYNLVIEPAGLKIPVQVLEPRFEIPCDFGVANIANVGSFFPSPCEPCPAGVAIGTPPGTVPSLGIPAAAGGCLRPRFFNGMFITREDLDTLVRYTRLKNQMQNRAGGQGVVWGLCVDRDGNKIAVHPGYGVDCCGHDLVVTTPYRVDIATLLRDPAAAPVLAQKGSQCLHLLLEYIECPEDPRPVHGDPCSPEILRCEMSRVRETVRLRLVPRRDYTPEGPMGKFLEELAELEKEPRFVRFVEIARASQKAFTTPATPTEVPYHFAVGFLEQEGAQIQWFNDIQPETTHEVSFSVPTIFHRLSRVYFRVEAAAGQMLLSGRVQNQAGEVITRLAVPSGELAWDVSVAELSSIGETMRVGQYNLPDLRVGSLWGATSVPQVVSSPAISVAVYTVGQGHLAGVQIPAVALTVEQPQLSPWPCAADPCCADGRPLFPVMPPFLHDDPLQPGTPADPKVLLAAVLYGWLASEEARHRLGTDQQVWTGRLSLAMFLYRLGLAFLFKAPSLEDQRTISEMLQRLYEAWCRGFLYPGPRCQGEPDGVILGCVQVAGGDMTTLDPWQGRRYVVHYPLLAHWGEQIGLTPLDVMVSRAMGLVCCLANLPVALPAWPGVDRPETGVGFVPMGRAYFVTAPSTFASVRQLEGRLNIVRREPVSALTLVNRAVALLQEPPAQPARRYVRYEMAEAPWIALVAPEPEEPLGATAVVDSLRLKVREIRPARRTPVPPLLADLSEDLTLALLQQTPLQEIGESPLREPLLRAGVRSLGDLLGTPAGRLHRDLAEEADPRELTRLLQANEKIAAAVAAQVNEVVAAFSASEDIVEPQELLQPERLGRFTERLREAVSGLEGAAIAPEAVDAAVQRLVRKSRRGRPA